MSEAALFLFGPSPADALVFALVNANLAGSAALVAVMGLRAAARRWLGPETVCGLWILPPLAGAGFALARHVATLSQGLALAPAGWPESRLVLSLWVLGALATALTFAVAQGCFMLEVRRGRAGPAVVGLISPRLVMPADDGRYSVEERELIRAHEREHVARKDPRAAAFAALLQCLCWFNPLVHLAARLLRLDQELVCDAAVVRSRPTARGLYARTLLKTQLAATPLPFGCYWPARGRHPLEMRVEALKRVRPGPRYATEGGRAVVVAAGEAIRP